MNRGKVLGYGLLAVVLGSCGDKGQSSVQEPVESIVIAPNVEEPQVAPKQKYQALVEGGFVVFHLGAQFIAAYRLESGKETLEDYADTEAIQENPLRDAVLFLGLRNGILVTRYGDISDPVPVSCLELVTGKELLPKEFRIPFTGKPLGTAIVVLKPIGRTLSADQESRLDKEQYAKMKVKRHAEPDTFGGLMYYEEYSFDLDSRKLTSLGIVFTNLPQ